MLSTLFPWQQRIGSTYVLSMGVNFMNLYVFGQMDFPVRLEFLRSSIKPALAGLRGDGVLIIVYIDDIILLADDPKTLIKHIHQTMTKLMF